MKVDEHGMRYASEKILHRFEENNKLKKQL
jgi:hypothetical protein